MNRYERQCRRLLAAFPDDFRQERGDDLVTTLMDDAPGAGHVSLRTAADLIATGTRMRARRAGAGDLRRSVAGGVEFAALAGLGLQAALAIAAVFFFVQHRAAYELLLRTGKPLPALGPASYNTVWHLFRTDFLAVWVSVAAVATIAFGLALKGRYLAAGLLSTLISAALPAVIGVSLRPRLIVPNLTFLRSRWFDIEGAQYMHSLAFLALAITTSLAAFYAASTHPRARHTWGWLAAVAILALVMLAVLDGHDLNGSLLFGPLRQGGVLVALEYLWVAGALIAVVWSWLDPRAGWAALVLSVPFVVYQLSPRLNYGSHDSHVALALVAVGVAVVALGATTTLSRRRLARR